MVAELAGIFLMQGPDSFRHISDGALSRNDRMLFTRWNRNDWYWKYESSNVYPSLVNEYYIFQSLFDACAPYSKWAQKYPRRK